MENEKIKQEEKMEEKKETKVESKETMEKTETKKEVKQDKPKKTEATARGVSVRASKRQCMYISSFIKGKTVDVAIQDLEKVIAMKKAVPFKGEVPHRKGKGMMSGRYPVNASKIFIAILKALRGNILVNGLDLDKTIISESVSNWASRPQRKGGVKSKRTHVTIIAREAKK